MRKIVNQEVEVCDNCNKQTYTNKCLGCEKDFCWECRERVGKKFGHSIHFGGSDDGFYCSSCLGKIEITTTPLFKAYKLISDLNSEYKKWWEDFNKRSKSAEEELKKLLH